MDGAGSAQPFSWAAATHAGGKTGDPHRGHYALQRRLSARQIANLSFLNYIFSFTLNYGPTPVVSGTAGCDPEPTFKARMVRSHGRGRLSHFAINSGNRMFGQGG